MSNDSTPTISVVIAAYQSEAWIAEAVDSVLRQTHVPDEVIVVDDGSTDGTAQVLAGYGDRIRVIGRDNGGCPAAFNTAFAAATGDFVALCGSDDVWEPRKLEWQLEAMLAHPDVDLLFGHSRLFGVVEADHARPPFTGAVDAADMNDALFAENFVCAPSVVIRRSLFERLGPFIEDFGADDYEYWFRCLRAGAKAYYDPRTLLNYRQHGGNLSARARWMEECTYRVRRHYAGDVRDRALVRRTLGPSLFRVGRLLVDEQRPQDARRAFRSALRYTGRAPASSTLRALAWTAVLSLPPQVRERTGSSMVKLSRRVDAVRSHRAEALA
jgi:glycosyltransferase involved in cell wall biosynthesis